MSYDWSRFEIFYYVKADAHEVFRRWATAQGLESFFIKRAVFTSPAAVRKPSTELIAGGDNYEWDWWHGFKSHGTILQAEPPSLIAFTFGTTMRVSVTISESHHGTQLHLIQKDIPTDADGMVNLHLDCRGGWIYFLTILKGVLEHGVDIRDKSPATAGSLAVRYTPDPSPTGHEMP